MKNINKYLCLVLLLTVAFSFACPKKNSGYDNSDWWNGYYSTKNPKQTPRGATVYSYENVTPSNLDNIDAGLARLFDIAARVYGYRNGLNFSDYRIILFKRSALCTGTAIGFAVRADVYDGSEYDKDPRPGVGVVCAAGLSAEFESPLAVVVQDDSIIKDATLFEGEHLILYKNDRLKWQETLFHQNGAGHPILPDTDGGLTAGKLPGNLTASSFEMPEDFTVKSETENLTIRKGSGVCLLLVK